MVFICSSLTPDYNGFGTMIKWNNVKSLVCSRRIEAKGYAACKWCDNVSQHGADIPMPKRTCERRESGPESLLLRLTRGLQCKPRQPRKFCEQNVLFLGGVVQEACISQGETQPNNAACLNRKATDSSCHRDFWDPPMVPKLRTGDLQRS